MPKYEYISLPVGFKCEAPPCHCIEVYGLPKSDCENAVPLSEEEQKLSSAKLKASFQETEEIIGRNKKSWPS